jgi:hypothetical protein
VKVILSGNFFCLFLREKDRLFLQVSDSEEFKVSAPDFFFLRREKHKMTSNNHYKVNKMQLPNERL